MKNTLLSLVTILLLFSCGASTYEKNDLYGHWKAPTWEFIFNEDGSCKVGKAGEFPEGKWTYRTFGNTLEISQNGKVFLSGLTIKGIQNDELTLEFRHLVNKSNQMNEHVILKRVN